MPAELRRFFFIFLEADMATYILLGNLTEEGAERLRTQPGWILDMKKQLKQMNVRVIQQYAVLGAYDLVTIIEAEDNRAVVRVSAELTFSGNLKVTTLPAIPIKEFLASL